MSRERAGFVDVKRCHDDVARKLPIFESRSEARTLDESQVGAAAVLLALRDDQVARRERANHRAHFDAEISGGPQAAVTEGDLVALWVVRALAGRGWVRFVRVRG